MKATVKEVAKVLSLDPSRIIQLIHEGKIKAVKFGCKNWMILDYANAVKRAKPGRPKKKGN
jgi:excisionase family DNA binding protein